MKLLKFLLFNRLAKAYLHRGPFSIFPIGKRFRAMSTELSYMLSIVLPFLAVIMIPIIVFEESKYVNESVQAKPPALEFVFGILFGLLIIGIINKDFFNGQSVVKRYLGYQVIDIKTSKPANHLKCMMRNITAPMWPVEVLFTLFNKQRRIGDLIAGTKVIEVEANEPEKILDEIQAKRIDPTAAATAVISVVVAVAYAVLVS